NKPGVTAGKKPKTRARGVVFPIDLCLLMGDPVGVLRDIKTTMGMDVLRCQSPEMVRKEILMHFIAYNGIRQLMCEAAKEADLAVRVVSFKGSLQALRNWEPHLNQAKISKAERFRLISDLYEAMTDTPIQQRPGRSEPRCRKRRPKNYQRLTAPRHEMKEIPHRNRYRAERT
ncbi:MAG: hypothetical protein JXB25_05250, partial [Deltaproteobacteria bacterium]|nr:hypothetical protein [Deltaproteobacteria bacterium]